MEAPGNGLLPWVNYFNLLPSNEMIFDNTGNKIGELLCKKYGIVELPPKA